MEDELDCHTARRAGRSPFRRDPKCSISELRSRIVSTQTLHPPLPIVGEGEEMSVIVFAKCSPKGDSPRHAGKATAHSIGDLCTTAESGIS
jgi:hypothetical protein